jgi:putative NIF3 family GTP cyclohydrolase 1 type 2
MRAREVQAYLQSLNTGWVNPDQTVDTFKAGDPESEVRGIAVGWMSYSGALERAVELGCNLFITHEPTYYSNLDDYPAVSNLRVASDKKRFIEASGLAIIRCHDLWDQMPGIGIPDSWAEFLGLGKAIDGEGYFRVYDVSGKTALQVAEQVADRVKPLGQEAVQLIGPAEKQVRRVSVGTGAIINFLGMVRTYHIDLAICTDDGIHYWRDGAYAIDAGLPMIVVHHHTSEEAGMVNLAKRLKAQFPDIPVHHLPQRCMYRLVSGQIHA